MADIVILYENFADRATLSGGSWLSALPLTNLQDADVGRVARSANATTTATQFKANLGSPKGVHGLAIGPCNLSPGSQWRARAYSDSAYTSLVYDTDWQEVTGEVIDWTDTAEWLEWEDNGFWLGISDFEALSELPQFLFHVVPSASLGLATAQYWKVEFDDTGNADGYVQSGRLMIAAALRPSHNYGEDNSLSVTPLTDVEESLGGRRAFQERGLRRSFRCGFTYLSDGQLFGDTMRMTLRSGISRQVFVVPDPDDATYGARRSFLATMKQLPAIQQMLAAELGTTAFDFEEVL